MRRSAGNLSSALRLFVLEHFRERATGVQSARAADMQALLSLAQAKAQRYADTVALFAALGGGWWNRQDVAPEKPVTIGDFFQ
jgi:hypothetical protein